MMSFAMQKPRVSPVAQATTVAMKRTVWARNFNNIDDSVLGTLRLVNVCSLAT